MMMMMMDDVVEDDDVPMLSATNWSSDYNPNRKLSNRNRSVSISIPTTGTTSTESTSRAKRLVRLTGSLRSKKTPLEALVEQENIRHHKGEWGDDDNETETEPTQMGMCEDPYCTECSSDDYNYRGRFTRRIPDGFHHHRYAYGGANSRVRENFSSLKQLAFGIMNPQAKVVQKWNQFVVISGVFAIFLDPLFFYLLSVDKGHKCMVINWPMTIIIVILRSMTDFIYLMHMLLQFRLAFPVSESRVFGVGNLVDDRRQIALHYLSGFFFLDLLIVLPLPLIIALLILQSSPGATYAQNLLRSAIVVQYIPKVYRFVPLIAGQSPTDFVFESAWANFAINLLIFVLAGHVVGSCWYLFGLQRVNQCLRDACQESGIVNCKKFIDCGHGNDFESFKLDPTWKDWKQNVKPSACFDEDGFPYGIYVKAVNLTAQNSIITRYTYSFFWGFQQIGTLAGNQTPSYFVSEILFTLAITGLGLLLFPLLIGNMQNFLQRRREKSLRRRSVEWWMSQQRVPEDLRRKVRELERHKLAVTQVVDEEMLLDSLPEDLQRDMRRHLYQLPIKKVRIFELMEEPILDAIYERVKPERYIRGRTTLYEGELVRKVVFIIRGHVESIEEDQNKFNLSTGDVYGEEVLTFFFDQYYIRRDARTQRKPGSKLISKRTVHCLTDVEAIVLQAVDLEDVINLFPEFMNNRRTEMAIKNASPYWRVWAATTIQVAWKSWKNWKSHASTSPRGTTLSSGY